MALVEMKKCRKCRKKFPVHYPELYVYKRWIRPGGQIWFCSYGCLRAWEREKEERRKQR